MKDVRPFLRAYLLADPTVSALVGGTYIHYARLPQNQVVPSIVFNKITELADYHMAGDSGLGQVRMQFDAWAQSADAATQLANAVYDRLSGHSGVIVDGTNQMTIKGQFMVNGRDEYDPIANLYRVSRDYTIWYGASE